MIHALCLLNEYHFTFIDLCIFRHLNIVRIGRFRHFLKGIADIEHWKYKAKAKKYSLDFERIFSSNTEHIIFLVIFNLIKGILF